MTATDLIGKLKQIGATVEASGEKLLVRFPEAHRQYVETLRPELEQLKSQVIGALVDHHLARSYAPSSPAEPVPGWEDREDDPYWQRAKTTLKKLQTLNWPFGLGPWLRKSAYANYQRLYTTLPNDIERLWDGRAPLDEFQAALDQWVDAHREALTLYRENGGRS